MMIVRPSRQDDLPGIERLILENVARVSSLPRERDKLSEAIDHSIRSFEQDSAISGQEFFLFVLEDNKNCDILGVSGIQVNADRRRPFYSYRLDELIHSSPRLSVHTAVPVLYLTHELTGKTVLSSLAIRDDYRESVHFDLLSRSRLLFIAAFRERFSDEIVVELQGVLTENDVSPFWDSLGRHFFHLDFATADYYAGVKSRTFLAEMIPAHPVYVTLLSETAQSAMGRADDRAQMNCQLLYREGFETSRYLDVFDGGPTLVAQTDQIATIQGTKQKQLLLGEVTTGLRYLAANQDYGDFRACFAQLTDGMGDRVRLDAEVAAQLALSDGDILSYVAL